MFFRFQQKTYKRLQSRHSALLKKPVKQIPLKIFHGCAHILIIELSADAVCRIINLILSVMNRLPYGFRRFLRIGELRISVQKILPRSGGGSFIAVQNINRRLEVRIGSPGNHGSHFHSKGL